MKRISTTGMDHEEARNLMGNLVGCFGNENIRGCHIDYFEKKVIELKENENDSISSAPDYYAWLWLMAEHIFWCMREFCFRKDILQDDDLGEGYKKIVERFLDRCRELNEWSEEELQTLFKLSVKTLEIRHAIVHKGFPNLLPATLSNTQKKPKFSGASKPDEFTEEGFRETTSWYSNPKNFETAKEEFELLIKAMCKAPGLAVDFWGLFSVSCGEPTKKSSG